MSEALKLANANAKRWEQMAEKYRKDNERLTAKLEATQNQLKRKAELMFPEFTASRQRIAELETDNVQLMMNAKRDKREIERLRAALLDIKPMLCKNCLEVEDFIDKALREDEK